MLKESSAADKVIVAIDCCHDEALELARKLQGHAKWLKVGMTLFYESGPQIVASFKEMGFSIFLDLKLHDIPHQVRGAAASAAASGADILSIHALGGKEMIEAAVAGAQSVCFDKKDPTTAIIGITVLTSMDSESLESVGIDENVQAEVKRLAAILRSAQAQGCVCSAQEAQKMRELWGQDALIVTPGVRLPSNSAADQRRVARPRDAIAAGASMIVVGRPITEAQDPVAAFAQICDDIDSAACC